jgi:hypothetical protein
MLFTFKPLGARVLVRREPLPEQTRSGLYLLGRDYPTIGRVVAVGTGWRRTKPWHCFDDALHCYLNEDGPCHCMECPHPPGHWRHITDVWPGQWVQWTTGFDYDLCSIFPTEPNLLLLDYDQINWVGTP